MRKALNEKKPNLLDENWVKSHKKSQRQKDLEALRRVKESRKGKKFRMIQIDGKTWIEKEVS